ncbi:MAG TPA: hypothetical protein VEO95_03465, partial [Chthoniobacteraceae bacterium]|nr:hypothetical protein [Chthoniobacteraceae bacterium]
MRYFAEGLQTAAPRRQIAQSATEDGDFFTLPIATRLPSTGRGEKFLPQFRAKLQKPDIRRRAGVENN